MRKASWWGRARGADLNTLRGCGRLQERSNVSGKILKALLLMTHTVRTVMLHCLGKDDSMHLVLQSQEHYHK